MQFWANHILSTKASVQCKKESVFVGGWLFEWQRSANIGLTERRIKREWLATDAKSQFIKTNPKVQSFNCLCAECFWK